MALDTQKEYQDEIDKTKKHFESGEKLLKDLNKKLSETQGSIKATETLMDLQEKKIDKLYKEGSSKGFKLKRAKELVAELRALETEDDYQDKIDDLLREVEDLYDEGTDKGYKLKREEEMEQEERALDTQADYQNEYDENKKKFIEAKKQKNKAILKLNTAKEDIKKWDKEFEYWADQEAMWAGFMEKLVGKANAKGFKLKRGEQMDFEKRKHSIIAGLTDLEARKQDVLDSLEARALETQEDYQKAYDKLDAKMKKENEEWSKKSLEILDKIEALQSELKRIEKQSDAIYDKDWHELKDIWDEAKKKGFKLKGVFRSEETDFEVRALETLEDYQKQYDKYANEAKKYEEEVKKWQTKINKLPDNHTERELNKLISEKKEAFDNMTNTKESMLYILKQAKKKGFNLKK